MQNDFIKTLQKHPLLQHFKLDSGSSLQVAWTPVWIRHLVICQIVTFENDRSVHLSTRLKRLTLSLSKFTALVFPLLALWSWYVFQASLELVDYRQTLLHPAYCLPLNNPTCDIDSLTFVITAEKQMPLIVFATVALKCAAAWNHNREGMRFKVLTVTLIPRSSSSPGWRADSVKRGGNLFGYH